MGLEHAGHASSCFWGDGMAKALLWKRLGGKVFRWDTARPVRTEVAKYSMRGWRGGNARVWGVKIQVARAGPPVVKATVKTGRRSGTGSIEQHVERMELAVCALADSWAGRAHRDPRRADR